MTRYTIYKNIYLFRKNNKISRKLSQRGDQLLKKYTYNEKRRHKHVKQTFATQTPTFLIVHLINHLTNLQLVVYLFYLFVLYIILYILCTLRKKCRLGDHFDNTAILYYSILSQCETFSIHLVHITSQMIRQLVQVTISSKALPKCVSVSLYLGEAS